MEFRRVLVRSDYALSQLYLAGRGDRSYFETREPVKVERPGVKVAAVAATCEVELREGVIGRGVDQVGRNLQVSDKPVIVEIVLVRKHGCVPAPRPFIRQVELARGLQATAPVVISGRVHKQVFVELKDARGTNVVSAIEQPLAPLAL